jgi:hypothetical protein
MIRTNRLLTTIVAATVATSAIGTFLYAQTAPAPTPPAPVAPVSPTSPVVPPADDNKARAMNLVEKAKELFQADKILDAKATNDAALKLAPDLLAAKVLDSKIKLRIAEMAGPANTQAANPQNPAAVNPGVGAVTDKLTNAQINRMRAYEVTAADKTLAGTVDQNTLADFWKEVILADPKGRSVEAKDRETFMTGGFAEQVRVFKESGRNDYIDKLKITGDPATIKAFKEINTWVINNCTYQPGCHAIDNSTQAFRIYTKGGETPANVYTNFFMMQKVVYNNQDLIDRSRPESSLLAQYGLPAREATATHPPTKTKIPQRFTGVKDPNYTKLVNALDQLKVIGSVPDYGFGGAAAPAVPATAPGTTPTTTTTVPAK